MDIPEFYAMAEELFTPEEAEVNNAMPRGPFTAKDLARDMGREEAELERILESMADKGLCVAIKMNEVQYYQSARFMPGILEFQFMPGKTTDRHKKLARLIQAYKKACDQKTDLAAVGLPPHPGYHRGPVCGGRESGPYLRPGADLYRSIRAHRGHHLLLPSCRCPARRRYSRDAPGGLHAVRPGRPVRH